MSTSWYAIEEAITVAKIKEVNEALVKKWGEENPVKDFINPIEFFHNLITDTYYLARQEDTQIDNLVIEDFDEKDGSFTRMTRYFQNGDNPTAELILRPLVELGGLTIVSEYDDDSPQGKAQNQLYEDQQKKENNKALA